MPHWLHVSISDVHVSWCYVNLSAVAAELVPYAHERSKARKADGRDRKSTGQPPDQHTPTPSASLLDDPRVMT